MLRYDCLQFLGLKVYPDLKDSELAFSSPVVICFL